MTRGASLVLAVALLVTGCESGNSPETGGEIVWATGAIDATTGPAADIAGIWNRTHPKGPTVRVEGLPQAADDQRQLMAIELKAGLSTLDVLSLDVIWTGEFAVHGWLADLTDIRPDVARASLPGPLQSGTWNGKLWAAPLTSGAGFLYYRTDLVAHPPTTWNELVEVGRRVGGREGIAPLVA